MILESYKCPACSEEFRYSEVKNSLTGFSCPACGVRLCLTSHFLFQGDDLLIYVLVSLCFLRVAGVRGAMLFVLTPIFTMALGILVGRFRTDRVIFHRHADMSLRIGQK